MEKDGDTDISTCAPYVITENPELSEKVGRPATWNRFMQQ